MITYLPVFLHNVSTSELLIQFFISAKAASPAGPWSRVSEKPIAIEVHILRHNSHHLKPHHQHSLIGWRYSRPKNNWGGEFESPWWFHFSDLCSFQQVIKWQILFLEDLKLLFVRTYQGSRWAQRATQRAAQYLFFLLQTASTGRWTRSTSASL